MKWRATMMVCRVLLSSSSLHWRSSRVPSWSLSGVSCHIRGRGGGTCSVHGGRNVADLSWNGGVDGLMLNLNFDPPSKSSQRQWRMYFACSFDEMLASPSGTRPSWNFDHSLQEGRKAQTKSKARGRLNRKVMLPVVAGPLLETGDHPKIRTTPSERMQSNLHPRGQPNPCTR